ncbi:hypothetical protein [Pseudidiomarina terrestris]|uniref:hypothetical protein n=1 Tax=Pseudidiomarina terrestris TaxID=2820060 RepID=UPI00264B1ADD|nr:hypothetical protein [Pseudidiomarina sp. 1ASP75-5]MDN7135804.1 hypothetical protein [Pseudidiomarina sp. 1ASP75-5]
MLIALMFSALLTATPPKLTWYPCLLGQTLMANECTGAAQRWQWNQAKVAIGQLDTEVNWRLPTVQELKRHLNSNEAPQSIKGPVHSEWLLTSSVMRHGDELLVAAVHSGSGKVEYLSVREHGLVVLVHD